MIDRNLLREHPETVKKEVLQRHSPVDVDVVLRLDKELRTLQQAMESKRTVQKRESAQARSETPALKALKEELQKLKEQYEKAEKEFTDIFSLLPNIAHPDAPVGKNATENIVLREVGKHPEFSFPVLDYLTLGETLGIIDVPTAAKVSGSRFGYLKGAAAWLEFALVQFGLHALTNEGTLQKIAGSIKQKFSGTPFLPVVPPVMITPDTYRRMGRLDPGQEDERYRLANDDLYLVGSAEHALGPMYMDTVLKPETLPLRYVGFSTCFRREAGSYGKDMKGILRVHQFDKLEMELFCNPDTARAEFDFVVACQEYLMQQLEIPYRIVAVCTGDMGGPDALQYDVESWFPSVHGYKETHSADYMTDFQARRLQTRVASDAGTKQFVHMIDATVFAIGRTLAALLENHQRKDGSVSIPKALRPYVPFSAIEKP